MIYVTGDTHGNLDLKKLDVVNFPYQSFLTKSDYVIITGDVAVTWDESNATRALVKWFDSSRFTMLFVDGNHENFDLLYRFPIVNMFGGKVRKISDSIYHLMRGEIYNIDGKLIFVMGGAKSHDMYLRSKGLNWWREEIPSSEEIEYGKNNLKRVNYKVDYIITHECSNITFEKMMGTKKDGYNDLFLRRFFDFIEENVEFQKWYFGHYHRDVEIDKKHLCVFNEVVKLM